MRSTLAKPAPRADDAVSSMPSNDVTLELLSSIAHEFRAPLSALAASAEMLPVADADERQRFSDIIQRQAYRLSSIVDGLLAAYRAPGASLQELQVVDVAEMLGGLTADAQVAYPAQRFRASTACTHVLTDRNALAMILGNLLSNAARYSPPASIIRIECDDEGAGSVRFRVFDQGPGVPEFLRRRIFRAGERGAFGGSSGCGLGLFIAQRLCDAIGAEIEIDDSYDGPGSCFAVLLPD